MIFALISAWLAYKKAKDTNRSAILWAAIAAVTFIGTQLLIQFGFGILLGIGIEFQGWSPEIVETYNLPITIFSVVISFISTWLVLRYLDKIPEGESYVSPPPPPDFN